MEFLRTSETYDSDKQADFANFFAFRMYGFKLIQPDLSFVGLVDPVGSQVQCAELVRAKCYTSVFSVPGSSDQLGLMLVCF